VVVIGAVYSFTFTLPGAGAGEKGTLAAGGVRAYNTLTRGRVLAGKRNNLRTGLSRLNKILAGPARRAVRFPQPSQPPRAG
jgi:hypothetical protein